MDIETTSVPQLIIANRDKKYVPVLVNEQPNIELIITEMYQKIELLINPNVER